MNTSVKNVIAVVVSVGFLAAFVFALVRSSQSNVGASKGTLNHVSSFEVALAQAKADGKTVAVDFKAEWCGPCKLMQKEAFVDSGVTELMKDTLFVSIDVDNPGVNQSTVDKYSPESLPTVLFFNSDGKVIGRTVGYGGVASFKSQVKRILRK